MSVRKLTKQEQWEANNRAETAAKRAMPVGAKLLKREEHLRVGDPIEDGRIVKYIAPDGTIYVSQTVPPSTTPVNKRDSATEKNMSERVSFDNLILDHPITKAADSVEFEFRDGMLQRVEVDMQLTSPKPTDGKRDPEHPAASFPRTASIVDREVKPGDSSVRPVVEPYDLTAAGTLAPQFVADENFIPAGQGEMFTPANFVAPTPKDRTAVDDATTGDFDADDTVDAWDLTDSDREGKPVGKAIRLGSGYLLKSEF